VTEGHHRKNNNGEERGEKKKERRASKSVRRLVRRDQELTLVNENRDSWRAKGGKERVAR